MSSPPQVLDRANRTLGSALGILFGAVAAARRARALHPRGAVVGATLHRLPHPPTGVDWLDQDEDERATVRFSRSAGLPAPLPDVLGVALAVRLASGRRGDLLLSTAGRAPVLRHLLAPRRDPARSTYTCLVPYVSDAGRIMLGALPDDDGVLCLAYATPRGPWHPFARLVLDEPPATQAAPRTDGSTPADDPALDLDAVLHPLPGLRMPDALARLREPAYARSRRERHAAGDRG